MELSKNKQGSYIVKKIIFSVVALLICTFTAHGETLFVDADGSDPVAPYSTWETAATNIQDAVDAAASGDTVLVNDGTYASGGAVTPGYALTNRVCVTDAVSVQSVNGPDVTIIRGFEDTTYPYEASMRGVFLNNGASLIGFTVTNGHASAYSGDYYYEKSGGGVFMTAGCTVSNCILTGNSARQNGGGAYLYLGGEISRCILTSNSSLAYGGGAYLYQAGAMENCLVINNQGTYYGGGLAMDYLASVKNSTICGNSAAYGGGGCYASGGTIYNSIVWGNGGSATRFDIYGGGTHYSTCSSDVTDGVNGCITNNPQFAGMRFDDYHLLANSPCIDQGDNAHVTTSVDLGGEPRIAGSSVDMGSYESPNSPSHIITTTVSGLGTINPDNPAVFEGNDQSFYIEAVYGYYLSSLTVDGSSIPLASSHTFSNVQSTHTISALFATDPHSLSVENGTGDGMYDIYTEVPVTADAGSAGFGFSEWTVDPVEYTDHMTDIYSASTTFSMPETNATITAHYALLTVYVDANQADDSGDGTSWATAKKTIQAAINLAAVDATVWVTNGVYSPSSEITLIRPLTVRSVDGAEETIIDGGGTHRCFNLGSSGGIISGFTITNGYASSNGGGGVVCDRNSSSRVENCILSGNYAKYYGGGMSYGVVSNSLIRANEAGYSGGGLHDCHADDCTISENRAIQSGGGGVYYGVANNCLITQNRASQRGGGGAWGVVNNCVISGNSIDGEEGGGLYDCLARNCTITGNSGVEGGGAKSCDLLNCIVWDNTPDNLWIGNGWVSNSCSPDVTAGVDGNITNAPMLVSSSHIATNSPCRGAGNYNDAVGVDLDGTPWANPPSMGCDEKIDGETPSGEIQVTIDGPRYIVTGHAEEYRMGVFGYAAAFQADFGNGTVRANEFSPEMQWAVPGTYSVVLSAYNDDYPAGVFATQSVVVVAAEASTVYVSTTGNDANDGSSWGAAKATIQAGVDAQAYAGGKVLLGEGTFFPAASVMIRKPIHLTSSQGAASSRVDGGHTYSCFDLGGSACMLSELTITNGYARYGGGVICLNTTPVVNNCILIGNESQYGGGGIQYGTLQNSRVIGNINGGTRYTDALDCDISNNNGGGVFGGVVEECTITNNNNAVGAYGGGIHSAFAVDCLISGNTARYGGGAYQATLSHCTIRNNVGTEAGGGIYGGSATDCLIMSNSATLYSGGGVYYASVTNCTISGNSAGVDGGGLGQSTADHCSITGNTATESGGGLYESTAQFCTISGNMAELSGGGLSKSTAINCSISENSAVSGGGGTTLGSAANCSISGNSTAGYGGGSQNTALNNCTVVGNTAREGGGNYGGMIQNSILWDNRPDNYHGSSSGAFNSCAPNLTAGADGNITDNPLLVSTTHIATNSPCIGAGNIAYTSGADFDGDLWADPPSMGCDETWPGNPVDGEISLSLVGLQTLGSGYSETYLISVIGNVSRFRVDFGNGHVSENALLIANQWTVPGLYEVVITAWNEDCPAGISVTETIQVQDAEATAIYVSTTGDDSNDGSSWANAKATIQAGVDAQTLESGLVLISDGVFFPTSPVLIEKRIQLKSLNGAAATTINGSGSHSGFDLGSSQCLISGFTITNCTSSAVFCDNTTPIIEYCLITGNSGGDGGGIHGGTANHCTISGNSASDDGGGIYNGNANHCIISGNSAVWGGGMFIWGNYTANHCLIHNNTARWGGGGGMYGTFNNCTIVSNAATDSLGSQGGGVYSSTLNNCIVWYNTAEQAYDDIAGQGTEFNTCAPEYAVYPTYGNINAAPDFVGGGNYRLQSVSPCIDSGSAAYLQNTEDLDGIPIPLDGDNNGTAIVDMGCYEFINAIADSDADGLADGDEVNTYGTDPTNGNTDGDRMGDGDEFIAGTNPLDPFDYFQIMDAGASYSAFTVYFDSLADRQYQLLGCSNLVDGIWFTVPGAELRMGVGGPDSISDTNQAPATRYYQLEVSQP